MKTKDIFWAIVEATIWYCFIYYLLYVLKNPVDLKQAAFILLALMYLGTMACPWVRHTESWKRMMGKK